MKLIVRRVARLLLPLARTGWAALPTPCQRQLRPTIRRLRRRLGLGDWVTSSGAYHAQLAGAHALVAIEPLAPVLGIDRAPTAVPGRPQVTTIVTAHDDAAFLDTCLWSVRAQDLDDWECVVVDDASLDQSASIVRRHAEEDPRVRLLRCDRNVGLAAARNIGLRAATGTFVTFLDADDFMFPRTLRTRLAAAASTDPAVAGSWCDWASVAEPAGLEFPPPTPGNFSAISYTTGSGENQMIATSPVYRRDVLESLGGYDESFRTAEDFEFATRFFRNGFTLSYAHIVGVAYRQKRSSMISQDPLAHARNAMRVYDYMSREMTPDAVSALAVRPFITPPRGIPSDVKRLERLVSFLTFAVIGGDDAQVDGIAALIPAGLLGPSSFLIDVDGRIDAAIRRHATRVGGVSKPEQSRIEASVKDALATRGKAQADPIRTEPHLGLLASNVGQSPEAPATRVRGFRLPGEAGPWDVCLVAKSSDAARELVLVGRELVERGLRVAMLDQYDADLRRTLHFEGIHRVTSPVADVGLIISSSGDDGGVRCTHHLVITAEPLIGAVPREVRVDRVHVRGTWEVTAWSHAGPVEVVGWHTRHDRIIGSLNPRDGQALRNRFDVVLLTHGLGQSPVPASEFRARMPTTTLLFTQGFGAEPGAVITHDRLPLVCGFVQAVVAVGPGIPADALAFGTPVVLLEQEDPIGDATLVTACPNIDGLAEKLEHLQAVMSPMASTESDPLDRHVVAALELLGNATSWSP